MPPGTTRLTCAIDWCFGAQRDRIVGQRTDGADQKLLPEGMQLLGQRLFGERFVLVSPPAADGRIPVRMIYDPATGQSGGVLRKSPGGSASYGFGISAAPTTIIYWDEDKKEHRECRTTSPSGETSCETKESGGGKEFTVLNTLAIKPAS